MRKILTMISVLIFAASTVYAASTNQQISIAANQTATGSNDEIEKPLIHIAQNKTDNFRIYKSTSPPVKAEKEEDLFSKPGNIVLAGLVAVAIGSAVYISSEYAVEKIQSLNITTPVENEEVFWITAIQGTAINYKEGDHVKISIQKHGEEEWIEQDGYGEINFGSGYWVVRFCRFGESGPFDIGNNYRFIATMKDYKGNFLAQDQVEKVTRK